MTAIVGLSPSPTLQFFDNLGNPAVGGSLLTQVGGVNYATYQDSAGSTALPNPIPLNSRGEISNSSGVSCQLFLVSGVTYTFTLYDSSGNQLNQSTSVGVLSSSSIPFLQAGTGAVIRTLQAKLRESPVSCDDFTGANDTAIVQAACAHMQALGGGTLIFPRTYNVASPIGSNMVSFSGCHGLVLDFSQGLINDTTTYTAGQVSNLFQFSGCTDTRIVGRVTSQDTSSDDSMGLQVSRWVAGCIGIDMDLDVYGGRAGMLLTSTAGAAYADKCRHVSGKIKTVLTAYPYSGQYSGYGVELQLDALSAHRIFDIYGTKQNTLRVFSKNQIVTSLITSYLGYGNESAEIYFFDRDSDYNQPAAPRITVSWGNQTTATQKDIKLHVNFLNPVASPWGPSITFAKYDNSGGSDTTGRGHVLDGFSLSGNMDLQGTNAATTMTSGAFSTSGTPDVCRNVRLKDLTITGNQALNFVNTPLIVLADRAVFENVISSDNIYMGASPTNGEVIFIGCKAANFAAATNETNYHTFIGCNITTNLYLAVTNKTFVNTLVVNNRFNLTPDSVFAGTSMIRNASTYCSAERVNGDLTGTNNIFKVSFLGGSARFRLKYFLIGDNTNLANTANVTEGCKSFIASLDGTGAWTVIASVAAEITERTANTASVITVSLVDGDATGGYIAAACTNYNGANAMARYELEAISTSQSMTVVPV